LYFEKRGELMEREMQRKLGLRCGEEISIKYE